MNKVNILKQKIKDKKPVIGASVTLRDPCIAELMAGLGFDFIWIDTEHSSLDKKDVQLHIMATSGTDAASFVRVPWNDPILVKPILEMGPDGIIFPFIKTAEEAEKAVSSCRYPPDGTRGFGPIRATRYGLIDRSKYIKESDSQIWKIMQIEHIDAVKNLKSIVDVDGVDSIVIGLNDLSASVGLLHNPNHEKIRELTDYIGDMAKSAGIPYGVAMEYNPKKIEEWLNRGVNWIELAGDFRFLFNAAREALQGTRNMMLERKVNCNES